MTKDVKGYLQDILERIDRISMFSTDGHEAFMQSFMIQDAILRNFEVMGEIVKRLDRQFTDQHPAIPWRRIAGFRDILIHDYEGVSVEVVWQVIAKELIPLRTAIEVLLASLPPDDDAS